MNAWSPVRRTDGNRKHLWNGSLGHTLLPATTARETDVWRLMCVWLAEGFPSPGWKMEEWYLSLGWLTTLHLQQQNILSCNPLWCSVVPKIDKKQIQMLFSFLCTAHAQPHSSLKTPELTFTQYLHVIQGGRGKYQRVNAWQTLHFF